ncbi:MAG: Y-family DNA polymerase [Fibrobacterales bacterium]
MSYTLPARERLFALVDVNNFYVSCERAFQPELWNCPVVVMSNNDGCAIARSQEAKDLGVSMGVPIFKIQHLIKKHGMVLRSSNYALYGDMSERFSQVLSAFSPAVEQYSIDECFIELTGRSTEQTIATTLGQVIKDAVQHQVHLPVCVGIGRTKTQAKLANNLAKPAHGGSGVYVLGETYPRSLYQSLSITDIWGIGKAGQEKLRAGGCRTIADFCAKPVEWVHKSLSIVGARTQKELQGVSCLELDEVVQDKKEIMCSRAFGTLITCQDALHQAVATYASKAVEKLWRQNLYAGTVTVFLRTDPFNQRDPQYLNAIPISFDVASNDVTEITSAAIEAFNKIFKKGIRYKKAGVMLHDLVDKDNVQLSLFATPREAPDAVRKLFETIRDKKGAGHIHIASTISSPGDSGVNWRTKSDHLSNRFTTRWGEVPVVIAAKGFE